MWSLDFQVDQESADDDDEEEVVWISSFCADAMLWVESEMMDFESEDVGCCAIAANWM